MTSMDACSVSSRARLVLPVAVGSGDDEERRTLDVLSYVQQGTSTLYRVMGRSQIPYVPTALSYPTRPQTSGS